MQNSLFRRLSVTLALPLLWTAFAPGAFAADAKSDSGGFFLHNGDTVVFYGDSITEQLMYGRDIENFVVTRFPKWHVRFINSGWSGDKVTGGGGGPIETRLKRDVLPYKPTVVTIFLGMNDGLYQSYNEAAFQTYSQGLTHIVDELKQKLPKARLTLLTPSYFDYAAKDREAPPAGQANDFGHPAADYNQTLLKYSAFVKQLGAERGIPVADLNAPMEAATNTGRRADPQFILFGNGHHGGGDGVHPDEVGHLIMAAAVLQTWHAPATVADITLTPGQTVTETDPLPWPVPDDARPAFAVSPLPGGLNVFRVHASSLPAANYTLAVDGKDVGMLTRDQLAAGVDLTQNPDLPQNRQAQAVAKIIQTRVDRWHTFFKGPNGVAQRRDKPTEDETNALTAYNTWLDEARAQADAAAQPTSHTFTLRPTGA